MHQDHAVFVAGIQARTKLRLTFYSKEDKTRVTRTCAPMDFGASAKAEDKLRRYQFWDFEGKHPLSLVPSQVRQIEALLETFEPSEFVTWRPRWVMKRDWGKLS